MEAHVRREGERTRVAIIVLIGRGKKEMDDGQCVKGVIYGHTDTKIC